MAEVDPDQEAALAGCEPRSASSRILRIVDHDAVQDQDDDETVEEPEQAPPVDGD
jgi:hypothetical protein